MAGRLSIVYPGSQAEEGFDERWQGRVVGSQVAKPESSWAIGTIDVRGLYQWVIYGCISNFTMVYDTYNQN